MGGKERVVFVVVFNFVHCRFDSGFDFGNGIVGGGVFSSGHHRILSIERNKRCFDGGGGGDHDDDHFSCLVADLSIDASTSSDTAATISTSAA
jgi:hypothetical protein